MKKLILIAILVAVGWQGYAKYQGQHLALASAQGLAEYSRPRSPTAETIPSQLFKCDGRTYCSQMTSCQEATFFLQYCPGVKMDGNNDGIPCEKQWCK
ncbi:MAG: excalibur calcium-binding domain-containing protein [Propionivibrio sp.]|uniref:excalibur calcium-binding domain-containing protein n=1 Tax=Propionivibrio sp. TaxID=2212460 RepID=UPI001A474E9D|nr:excalibur calcium-binding domain-containing protein [Propionivibrio sp.]